MIFLGLDLFVKRLESWCGSVYDQFLQVCVIFVGQTSLLVD